MILQPQDITQEMLDSTILKCTYKQGCSYEGPASTFCKGSGNKSRLFRSNYCKSCASKKNAVYKKNNRETVRRIARAYYHRHASKERERRKVRYYSDVAGAKTKRRTRYKEKGEHERLISKNYLAKNPEICKLRMKINHRRRQLKILIEKFRVAARERNRTRARGLAQRIRLFREEIPVMLEEKAKLLSKKKAANQKAPVQYKNKGCKNYLSQMRRS